MCVCVCVCNMLLPPVLLSPPGSELSYSSLDESEEEEEEISSGDEVDDGSDDSAFGDMDNNAGAFTDL
jgi:hypothetical protein